MVFPYKNVELVWPVMVSVSVKASLRVAPGCPQCNVTGKTGHQLNQYTNITIQMMAKKLSYKNTGTESKHI